MKTKIIQVCALILLAAFQAVGQQPAPAPEARAPQPGPDPLGQNFFPPELVMQNQQAIALTEEQKTYFRTVIRDAQLKFTDLQWKLLDEVEKMLALVKQPHVDEQQTLAQLEKVLLLEREIKRAQITLLVEIKNKLTADQQAKLEDLRGKPVSR
jgi:Spy/CpxP family protein refolding chaperone